MSMSIDAINAATNWWVQPPSPVVQPGSDAANTPLPTTSSDNAASNPTTPSAASLASAFDQFSAELQSMLAQSGAEPSTATTSGTAATTSAGDPSTQHVGGGHHHHHGGGGAAYSASNAVEQSMGDGGTTSIANIGSTFAADVLQALQNYGGLGSQQPTGTLTTTA